MSDSVVLKRETRTARKTHACQFCDKPILKGERYVYASGLLWGNWMEDKRCISCSERFKAQ